MINERSIWRSLVVYLYIAGKQKVNIDFIKMAEAYKGMCVKKRSLHEAVLCMLRETD